MRHARNRLNAIPYGNDTTQVRAPLFKSNSANSKLFRNFEKYTPALANSARNSGNKDLPAVPTRPSTVHHLHGLRSASFDLTMSGPGNMQLGAVGASLSATVSGSGNLRARGLALASASVVQSGPGNVSMDGLVRDLRVRLSGSGDLKACALAVDTLNLDQRGPGSACIGGAIKEFTATIQGSGNLTASTLQAGHARLFRTGCSDVDERDARDSQWRGRSRPALHGTA